jgi:hypothetical protein
MKSGCITKSLALLLALISFPRLSTGAEKAGWIGPGTVSCADFGRACRDDPKNAENLFFSWALGFMSGLNTELLNRGETDLNELPMDKQKEFIRAECKAHPQAAYFAAVFDLYNRMRRDQGLPSYYRIWREPQSRSSPGTK